MSERENEKQQVKTVIGYAMTCKTRLGRFRSSSSVICVRYVGRSNTGGLLKDEREKNGSMIHSIF